MGGQYSQNYAPGTQAYHNPFAVSSQPIPAEKDHIQMPHHIVNASMIKKTQSAHFGDNAQV